MGVVCEELSKYSTCDISDGLLNFCNIEDGGFFPNLTRWSGNDSKETVAGKAYTVLFAPIDDPREAVNYIDSVPEGSFLVISLTKDLQSHHAPYVRITQAVYGGLMSTRAQYLKSEASAVFGRIRDLQEHQQLKHSVFSYGLSSCGPNKVVKPVAVNVSLTILINDGSEKVIYPGDHIIGDVHGIVRIPSAKVDLEKLLDYVKVSVKADELVAQDITFGVPAKQAQKDRRVILKSFR
ncbi:hypothetical protein HG535_0F02470 [Zygotorulaspora mrakii]|uniref:4-hydroxy-4-methyl-2-oxoglutarate aldolase n=1 Tax=Zygotorulaspora mrakii TaxID=42260 RepID=A0A7H9B603_ZYGMR|nr:uncharacterized protein HG535_0F02470 [Zygotorulaspora mrakii]QLG73736.1 hypothetical protein HG535_0F02470 [Zygotorulaspora mrakii]